VGADRQEIEWQYTVPADGLGKVEEWLLGEAEPFRLAILKGSSKELEDTYYDTGDWRLYQAGYALRVRREEGGAYEATMKSLVPADGNLHRRRELSEPLRSGEVETLLTASGPVGAQLKYLVDTPKVGRIFEIRTCRQTFGLVLEMQATNLKTTQTGDSAIWVGEVALDSSEIPIEAANEPVYLARVEVEINASTKTAFSELEGFVKAMERDLELRPATTSKYEMGLSATGQNSNQVMNLEVRKSFGEE